ncbi:MAG: Ku protein [Polyangiaceae bacterium]|nr:Ku protein [Polyangiaceae bacterium]
MRSFWSGEIAFGLVTIPAKLYTATKDLTPQFHQLHTSCGTRISMVRRCPKCNRDLAWDEIGKGYEVSKGEYALFSREELAKLDGDDTTGTIEIVEFVDPLEVDLAYVEKSYWVGPGSKNVRGYELLRAVLDEAKKVALAKVKLRTRTRLALLRPRGRLFSLDMMRFAEELVAGDEIAPGEGKAASDRERQLAMHLVDELSGPFDPAKHPDEYRSAVLAAVDEKVEAGQVARDTAAAEGEATGTAAFGAQVIDLAELLSKSIQVANKPGPAKTKLAEPAEDKAEKAKTSGPKKKRAAS